MTTSLFAAVAKPGRKPDPRLFELRVYYAPPGKFENIVDRFRQHTLKLFEKHGMENVGYWVPTDTTKHIIYYILAYPNREARDASWKAFGSDPAWKEVVAKTEANGKIVQKVETYFMTATDFSPALKLKKKSPERTFELRTYTGTPGHIEDVLTRFRNHTTKLFEKHGMENIVYFTTVEKDGAQSKLLYLLAHKSEQAGKESFDSFRKDPNWIKVRDESEKAGKIVEKVESVYLKPTDYSPMK